MKLCIIAGARPNFMKIAAIIDAINDYNHLVYKDNAIDYYLVHTGQHYDERMSKLFFDNLGIPKPDIDLEVGSASHAVQSAEIMKRFENVCLQQHPTHILVVGDVNSTIACALVASKLGIKVIHVEAGLRSFDRRMPEEINRILTDAISDYLFTTEESANVNLRREGISGEKIHFVGNVMIDTLLKHKKKAEQSDILERLGLKIIDDNEKKEIISDNSISTNNSVIPYAVLTLHRPSNVDNKSTLQGIIEALNEISEKIPVIMPIHPRTLKRLKDFELTHSFKFISDHEMKYNIFDGGVYCIEPLGYLDFLQLMSNAKLVLTDSGGIQEETTILGIPCVTLRENTERPITVTKGTNVLCGVKKENIVRAAFSQLDKYNSFSYMNRPPLWDGRSANRIVDILAKKEGIIH